MIFVCDEKSQTNLLARVRAYQYIVGAYMRIYTYMGARGVFEITNSFAVLYQYRKMLKNFEKTLYKRISKSYYGKAVIERVQNKEYGAEMSRYTIFCSQKKTEKQFEKCLKKLLKNR